MKIQQDFSLDSLKAAQYLCFGCIYDAALQYPSLKAWGDQLGKKRSKRLKTCTVFQRQLRGETGQLNKNFKGASTKGRNYWFNFIKSFDYKNLRDKTFVPDITSVALGKRQISMWKNLTSEETRDI